MDQRGRRQLGISHFKVPLFGQETPLNDSFWQQGFVKEIFDLELKFWFLMVAESIGVRITFKGKGMWSVVFRIETSPLHFQVHIRLQQRQNGPRTFFLFGRKTSHKTSHKPLVFFFLDFLELFFRQTKKSFFCVIKVLLPWLPMVTEHIHIHTLKLTATSP